jgi:hypothetical protein
MGDAGVVERYGRQTLRVLRPGGIHVALDFYGRRADPAGYAATDDPEQRRIRASARLLGWLADPQLRQSYRGIWDHRVELNDVLDRASLAAGATVERSHRQTVFAHLPLLRLGPWTLCFSFAGYNERKATYHAPGVARP